MGNPLAEHHSRRGLERTSSSLLDGQLHAKDIQLTGEVLGTAPL